MATLLDSKARAYVYSGDWVADCARPGQGRAHGCGNTEYLFQPVTPNGPRVQEKPFFICSNCGFQTTIVWPRQREAILAVLMLRPVPQTRNWYPENHDVAIRFNIPHGQSVDDLRAENAEHDIDPGVTS